MNDAPKLSPIDRIFAFIEGLGAGDRLVLKVTIAVFLLSLIALVVSINSNFLVTVPHEGGSYTEGVVGTPRFVNPILATTGADKDLVTLTYAGLMRLGKDGELANDMAESVTLSEDGLVYNVVLRDDIFFHDGFPVTSDDVLFTISRIQDPAIKSPLRASWEGVAVEYINERELNIVLPEPYAPFMENLTIGILPEHIWSSAGVEEFPFSQYNSDPIGSGPYRVTRISRNASGIPQSYLLQPFDKSHRTPAHITSLRLNFYSNEEAAVNAFVAKEIHGIGGVAPEHVASLSSMSTIHTTPLPRSFAVFLNQNENEGFRDRAVRQALDVAIDRERIINEVLNGFGQPATTPVPPGFGIPLPIEEYVQDLDRAREILTNAGWEFDENENVWIHETDEATRMLSFSITTLNTEVLRDTANILRENWEALGIPVQIKQFEQSDLTQAVIRPREYEALLFGTTVGRELDLFSFWHSSQRNDPGLNIALYANITTDALLRDARTTSTPSVQEEALLQFVEAVREDTPALFLFVPEFIYAVSPAIENIDLTGVADPHERFAHVESWYIEEESVWSIFTQE